MNNTRREIEMQEMDREAKMTVLESITRSERENSAQDVMLDIRHMTSDDERKRIQATTC